MSNEIQGFKRGDRVKLSLTGEIYEVLENDGLFVKTRNLNTGYARTFPFLAFVYQVSKIKIVPSEHYVR
ncbi:MAG: hypothetical protein AB4038_05860 [Prochloraceae cyanobacterium]